MIGDPGWADPGKPGISMGAAASGFARIFQSAGNQIVYEATAPYRLAPYAATPPALAAERLGYQPSRMLRAQFEIVPFNGRDTELRQLRKWRDAPPSGTSVMLIHGPGGQGKTRLAGHLARAWSNEGWLALRAFSHDDRSGPDSAGIPFANDLAGVLVVVDYAERWSTTDLLTLLRDTAAPASFPVRVLLLARPAGTWWQTLAYRMEHDRDIETSTLLLPPLGEASEDRLGLFAGARDEFAARLNVPDPLNISPPPNLRTDEGYGLVLTVHMAALAAVLARANDDILPNDPSELSAFLLARERESWQALHRQKWVMTTQEAMAQTVYTATLTGPLSHDDGLAALKCAQVESREHPGQILKDHAFCYPSRDAYRVFEPLYPDRLGEDFIALTTPGHADSAFPADPWASGALLRLLTTEKKDKNQTPVWVEQGLTVLGEAADRWPHIAALTGIGSLTVGRHRRPVRP
jgi:hypothetical protein